MSSQAGFAEKRGSRPYRRLAIHSMIAIFVWLAVAGCSTAAVVDTTPKMSLNFIRYVITNHIPRGVRLISPNDREYYSNYFSPHDPEEDATEKRERAYVSVLVLGDRRPYRMKVSVHLERKTNSGYTKSGHDKNLAKQIAGQLEDELAKGRDDRNVIDDFRPF